MKEWMGRLRTAVVKCNYKEIDRQTKNNLYMVYMMRKCWWKLPESYQYVMKMLTYIVKMC